jgi:hypothetical protein
MAHPAYYPPTDQLALPSACSSESRIVLSTAAGHPVVANDSHPAVCQQYDLNLTEPPNMLWQVKPLINTPATSGTPSPHSYYNYMASMVFSLQDPFH